MNSLRYTLMSGAGNTFVVLDRRELPSDATPAELAVPLCERFDVDGLIAVEPALAPLDFRMLYFNRDGSTGMMCGNGGRCAVAFARSGGLVADPNRILFENAGVDYTARLTELGVSVAFPPPRRIELGLNLVLPGRSVTAHFVDVGTPHVIVEAGEFGLDARSLGSLDIDQWGAALRGHERFSPEGANANFIALDGEHVLLRTFERGVEGETGACGTGAIASALVTHLLHDLPSPITLIPTSGRSLRVHFTREGESFRGIELEGDAEVEERVMNDEL